MRILIINSCNTSGVNSEYVFVKEQADALQALGLTIDFFCIKGKGPLGYLNNFKPLIQKIQHFKPDIVHAHYGLSGLLANFQRKVPVVTTYHGSDINNSKAFLFSKLSIMLSAHNIFVTEKIRNKSSFKHKSSLIPCGVDTKLFKPINKKTARVSLGFHNEKIIILFAGSFHRYVKNAHLAKEAISLLPNFELVELNGYSRNQVAMLINAADAVLMTSFSEGSPQLIKEAMACNCPIVSVPVGDVPELFDNMKGYFISTYDANDIADNLQKAVNFHKTSSGHDRILAMGLDNEMVAKQLREIYVRLLKIDKVSNKYERPEMFKFLPKKINRCIEFGCADGLFSKIVKKDFDAECWGVDINQVSVLNAERYLDKVICGDAMTIIDSLPEDYFDCLICNDFLEHLVYPDLFLDKISKRMKEGAYLVASFPNVRSLSNVFEFLIKKDWKYKDTGILDNTHFRFFTMKSLKRFLEENNFEIELFQGTRPLTSRVFLLLFILFDIMTLGYNHDMKYSGIGIRAIFSFENHC